MKAGFLLLALVACDRTPAAHERVMVTASPHAEQTPAIDVSDGMASPEAIAFDRDADVYLVSNINGAPHAKDDNGYISRVSPDGRVLVEHWIDGASPDVQLDGPRGIAIHGDAIYVADVDALRVFDRVTGAQRASWPVPDAHFPNDLRVDADNNVWLTETGIQLTPKGPIPDGDSTIWRFSPDGAPTVVAKGADLAGPNGIVLTAGGPVAASFLGYDVYRLVDGRPVTIATLPYSELDGLVQLPDGSFLVSSWKANGVYQVFADGSYRLAYESSAIVFPASIEYDETRSRVLIPITGANMLRFEPFSGRPKLAAQPSQLPTAATR